MSFANREASHNGTLHAEPFARGGGAVRNELSTALVKLYRELFGRGPVTTTTYAFEAGYVTFLRDVLAPHEQQVVPAEELTQVRLLPSAERSLDVEVRQLDSERLEVGDDELPGRRRRGASPSR